MPRRPWIIRPLVAAAALPLSGCVVSARLSVVPTIDTTGAAGVEVKATLAGGFGGLDSAVLSPGSVGVDLRKAGPRGPDVLVDAGLEYLRLGEKTGDLGFRVGAMERTRFYVGNREPPAYGGVRVETALLPALWTDPDQGAVWKQAKYLSVGPTAEASWLTAPGSPSFGRVGLGLSLDWYKSAPIVF